MNIENSQIKKKRGRPFKYKCLSNPNSIILQINNDNNEEPNPLYWFSPEPEFVSVSISHSVDINPIIDKVFEHVIINCDPDIESEISEEIRLMEKHETEVYNEQFVCEEAYFNCLIPDGIVEHVIIDDDAYSESETSDYARLLEEHEKEVAEEEYLRYEAYDNANFDIAYYRPTPGDLDEYLNSSCKVDDDENSTNISSSVASEIIDSDALISKSSEYIVKSRWRILLDKFNGKMNENPDKTNVVNYFENLQKSFIDNKWCHYLKNRPINVGIPFDKKSYLNYMKKLPIHLMTDYLSFRNNYCFTTYGFILDIVKKINGSNNYQIHQKKKRDIPLYLFGKEIIIDNFKYYHIASSQKLIDIPKSYILLKEKIETPLIKINSDPANFKSVKIYGENNTTMIINLPYYSNIDTPRIIFSYVHLIHTFVKSYCTDFDNHDEKQYVICPVHILSYLHEYCKQLEYIEQNCLEIQN